MADIDNVNLSEPTETLAESVLETITKDDLPCNVYDVAQTEPLVLLGKINEVVSHLQGIGQETAGANNKATAALDAANDAKSKVSLAVSTANSANTQAGDALAKATNAQNRAESAYSLAESSLTIASSASDIALDAQQKAEQALDQVVGGVGSKVYDHNGNLMTNVKLVGENGINIDHNETDPDTLDIRLDDTITSAIEANHTQGQTNASRLDSVEGIISDITPKVSKALITPLDAPAETQLVAVDTTNAQKMIGVGEGLSITNGDIQVAEELLNELDAKANDNSVVHLAGSETITGGKTFEYLKVKDNIIRGGQSGVLKYQGSGQVEHDIESVSMHGENYIRYASGVIMQTGTFTTSGASTYQITLPIAMPNNDYIILAHLINYAASKIQISSFINSQTNTQFNITCTYYTSSNNYTSSSTFRWVAIHLPKS